VDKLRTLPKLADIASDLQDQGLQAYVTIDRDTAGRLGITPAAISNALYNAFGQRLISTIFTQASQYRVVLEVKPEYRLGPTALNDIYLPGPNGVQVPLTAVATVSERPGALSINHLGQFPATTISFNLAKGASLGQAVDAIEAARHC
jgi:multidrug efflux pump